MSLPVMPTRILLVGGGGREHALAWRLAAEPGVNTIVAAPGSDAIAEEPRVVRAAGVDPLDPDGLVALALAHAVELAVIGPEAPLAAGVADALVAAGVPTFGPTRGAARIETSKAFCRDVAEAAGVRMARGRAFDRLEPALAFARELAGAPGSAGVVVKVDGLAGGKGVTVCDGADGAGGADGDGRAAVAAQAGAALEAAFATGGDTRVVVEERLVGCEASVIALCDGTDAIAMAPARDHKRIHDGDRGPNTGGMGAYSPLHDLPDADAAELVARIHRPILAELARRGTPFRGALYAGLMLTADGPALLECNARFGDPETQAVLPRLGVPFGPLLLACARGALGPALRSLRLDSGVLPTTSQAAVAIVLAAAGYPGTPRTGDRISGLDAAVDAGALVFHAGTCRDADGTYRTAGGRVLAVVGRGPDIETARDVAEHAADLVTFDGMQRRHDIAADAAVPAAGATR